MPPRPDDAVLRAPRPPVALQAAVALPAWSPLVSFAACAAGVTALDLGSKQLAAGLLASRGDVPLTVFGDGVRLAVVLNDQSAFGVSLGPYTWHINFALTLIALVLAVALCRALSALDSWAPVMLGLIAGAAMGNLVSLIASPKGVLDFIAVSSGADQELVFNLADVAAALGVVLLVRTAWTVGREIARGNR